MNGRNGRTIRDSGAERSWFEPAPYMVKARQARAEATAKTWRRLWAGTKSSWRQGVEIAKRATWSLINAYARGRQRRAAIAALSALDDRVLKDIGILRSDIALAVGGHVRPPEEAPRPVLGRPNLPASAPARGHRLPQPHRLPDALYDGMRAPARAGHGRNRAAA